jgi:CDP-glycerol glycerophosphotransferase (TagB/SpsB family)
MDAVRRALEIGRRDGMYELVVTAAGYAYRQYVPSRALFDLFQLVLFALSFAIERRSDLWVFGSHFGYADNSKYMYLYVHDRVEDVEAVWVGTDRDTIDSLKESGYAAASAYTLRGLRCLLRARVVLVTRALTDVGPWGAVRGARTVLLGHGTPMMESTNVNPLWERLEERFATKRFDDFVVTGDGRPREAFERTDYYPTGDTDFLTSNYPRTDALFGRIRGSQSGLERSFDEILDRLSGEVDVLFYLPTKRHYDDTTPLLTERGVEQFDEFLGDVGAHLVVKLHPRDEPGEDLDGERITMLPTAMDIYPVLRHSDVLITDYSSVYLDFLLLDRPIVFFPYDIDEFTRSRPMIFEYESVTPGPKAATVESLLEELRRTLTGTDGDADRRAALRDAYFESGGGSASADLFERIRRRVTAEATAVDGASDR